MQIRPWLLLAQSLLTAPIPPGIKTQRLKHSLAHQACVVQLRPPGPCLAPCFDVLLSRQAFFRILLHTCPSHTGLTQLLPPERTPGHMSLQSHPPLLHGPAVILSFSVRLFDCYLSPSEAVSSGWQEPRLQVEGWVQTWGLGILLGRLSLATLPCAEYCFASVIWLQHVVVLPCLLGGAIPAHLEVLSPIFSSSPLIWPGLLVLLSRECIVFLLRIDNLPRAGIGLTLMPPILPGICLVRRVISDEDQESQRGKEKEEEEEEEPSLCWNSLNSKQMQY